MGAGKMVPANTAGARACQTAERIGNKECEIRASAADAGGTYERLQTLAGIRLL